MKKMFLILSLLGSISVLGQATAKPKLVVGIVVDQMRWDYLYRYSERYSNGGLKKLLKEGFSCEQTFIPYTPTYTAPGHACIYTGSVPSIHGIIGNYWFDRNAKKSVYCTDDSTVRSVGSNSVAGMMSPRNMWANTITDELRISNNYRGKTIAIALKDRGSILPGGHTANAAYWFDNSTGSWISSTFYMDSLPGWVQLFNEKKIADNSLKKNWEPLFPIDSYRKNSTEDVKPYEDNLPGEDNSFIHKTDTIRKNRYESFRYTPGGNTITFEMAKAALLNEKLGLNGETDFLAISFSSTDYIGHAFGPNSMEVEDTYLRFDLELASFLKILDQQLGKGNYLLFLTADHGVAHVAGYAHEHKMPAGIMDDDPMRLQLNTLLQKHFNINTLVSYVTNYQVYLDNELIRQNNIDPAEVRSVIINYLVKHPAVSKAFDAKEISQQAIPAKMKNMVVNGYNQKLSGDIIYIYKPQWYDRWSRGTTHGLAYPYDAHIPLLWYGWKIKPGKTYREIYMTDIAVTLASLLQVQMPNGAVGNVIEEIMK